MKTQFTNKRQQKNQQLFTVVAATPSTRVIVVLKSVYISPIYVEGVGEHSMITYPEYKDITGCETFSWQSYFE